MEAKAREHARTMAALGKPIAPQKKPVPEVPGWERGLRPYIDQERDELRQTQQKD